MIRALLISISLAMTLCLAPGCTPPIIAESDRDPPALRAIRARYQEVVHAAHADPTTNWHSSWTGNMLVNGLKGKHRGLCYQWQDYIYRGVEPTVRRVGWSCTGLVSNERTSFEHHCVLVWDPRVISENDILPRPEPMPVPPRAIYVLDAWHEGTPNIHWLDEWLENESPHRSPPRLQKLPEMKAPAAPVPAESPEGYIPGAWNAPRPNAGAPSAR